MLYIKSHFQDQCFLSALGFYLILNLLLETFKFTLAIEQYKAIQYNTVFSFTALSLLDIFTNYKFPFHFLHMRLMYALLPSIYLTYSIDSWIHVQCGFCSRNHKLYNNSSDPASSIYTRLIFLLIFIFLCILCTHQ